MAVIQVFEHQTLQLDETIQGIRFEAKHLDRLEHLSRRLHRRCFTLGARQVRFHSYVGVLQLGGLTVEILPKLDRTAGDVLRWQSVLIDMLVESRWMMVEKIAGARLQMKNNSLLEFFITLFLEEIKNRVLPGGIPITYERVEQKLEALKGKPLISRQLRENPVLSAQMWASYDQLSKRHWINQLLNRALETISRLKLTEKIRKEARLLQRYFPKSETPSPLPHATASIPHRFRHCRTAVDLARMIAQAQAPDVQAGHKPAFALLFDMNRLFEAFVLQQLKKHQGEKLRVYGKSSSLFWQDRQLRPDIVVAAGRKNWVMDTKWKIIQGRQPGMEDLRQLFVYAQYFEAPEVMLIYPKTEGSASTQLIPFHHAPLSKAGISCQILMLDLFTPLGSLRKDVGKELITPLLKTSPDLL